MVRSSAKLEKRWLPKLVANIARETPTSTAMVVKAGPQAKEMSAKMGSVPQLELPTSEPFKNKKLLTN